MNSRRSVLVLGASGFVGRHLVPALRAAGWRVLAGSRGGGGPDGVPVDVTDAASVSRALRQAPDAVVHAAALAHGRRGLAAGDYDAVNHGGTRNVVLAARAAGVCRLVLFSSASVYGERGRRHPVREDEPLRPTTPYARSKARAEEEALAVGGVSVVALRPPAMYAAEWLPDVRKRVYLPGSRNRVVLRVPGRPPRHSLCAVQNAVDAVAAALDGRLPEGIYNVADDEPYTQPEMAGEVARFDGVSARVVVPRWAARAVLAPGLLLPRVGAQVSAHYWKLFEGLILDTARLRAAGVVPTHRLHSVLAAAGRAA